MSDQYYSPEELDAMDVGTEIPTESGSQYTKQANGLWYCPDSIFPPGGSEFLNLPKPLSAPLSASQPTYPTPTLGELVALRESYREPVATKDGTETVVRTVSLGRLTHVDRLIDERIGL